MMHLYLSALSAGCVTCVPVCRIEFGCIERLSCLLAGLSTPSLVRLKNEALGILASLLFERLYGLDKNWPLGYDLTPNFSSASRRQRSRGGCGGILPGIIRQPAHHVRDAPLAPLLPPSRTQHGGAILQSCQPPLRASQKRLQRIGGLLGLALRIPYVGALGFRRHPSAEQWFRKARQGRGRSRRCRQQTPCHAAPVERASQAGGCAGGGRPRAALLPLG